MLNLRYFLERDIEFSVSAEPECDIPIEGFCSAFDPETDAAEAARIRSELDIGNDWAWCTVTVSAEALGQHGAAALGGCSYDDESQFRADGYFQYMRSEAVDALLLQMDAKRLIVRKKKNRTGVDAWFALIMNDANTERDAVLNIVGVDCPTLAEALATSEPVTATAPEWPHFFAALGRGTYMIDRRSFA